jgi:hypothetical protein
MSEKTKKPKKIPTALVVVAIVGMCLLNAIARKFTWGMFGDNSSWNTWKHQIIGGIIVPILTLLTVYFLNRKNK